MTVSNPAAPQPFTVTIACPKGTAAPGVAEPWGASFNLSRKSSTYKYTFSVTRYPTGNCQLTSIGYANQILSGISTYIGENPKTTDADAIATINYILKEAYRQMGMVPLQIMVDVRTEYSSYVDKWFDVCNRHPYKSTNGSNMVLYMVKLKPDIQTVKAAA